MVSIRPQQCWPDPAGQSWSPLQVAFEGPRHTWVSGMQRIGGSWSASRQQVVTPGSQGAKGQGSIPSKDMSIAASWVSTNLQPWVGAEPQHPDIWVTIAAPAKASTVRIDPPTS